MEGREEEEVLLSANSQRTFSASWFVFEEPSFDQFSPTFDLLRSPAETHWLKPWC